MSWDYHTGPSRETFCRVGGLRNGAMRPLFGLGLDRRGVTALEYGLISAVVAVVMVVGAAQLGINEKKAFSNLSTYLK